MTQSCGELTLINVLSLESKSLSFIFRALWIARQRGRDHLGQYLLCLPDAAEKSLHELLLPPCGGWHQSFAGAGVQVRRRSRIKRSTKQIYWMESTRALRCSDEFIERLCGSVSASKGRECTFVKRDPAFSLRFWLFWSFSLCLQRSRAFPGHHSEGGESPTGGRAQICGAAEETVRLFDLLPCGVDVHCLSIFWHCNIWK